MYAPKKTEVRLQINRRFFGAPITGLFKIIITRRRKRITIMKIKIL
jgi:hypothetical protein